MNWTAYIASVLSCVKAPSPNVDPIIFIDAAVVWHNTHQEEEEEGDGRVSPPPGSMTELVPSRAPAKKQITNKTENEKKK